jgi:DNA mismatch endonuclease (patch repair protein)
MAAIRAQNTRPEMLVRRGLHALGWRYRLHDRKLPGRPDLVFRRRRAVVFVNGCFWHGHDCHLFRWPKTEAQFWRQKIAGNVRRDISVRTQLQQNGWRVGEIWECALKGRERRPLNEVLGQIDAFLRGEVSGLTIGTDRRVTSAEEPQNLVFTD